MEIAYAGSVDTFIANVNREIINPLILLLFALAVAYFLWGMLKFFSSGQNEERKTEGKQHMLWGVVGMTIMMGVFFILNLILSTFDIQGVNPKEGTVELNFNYDPDYTFPNQ